MEKIVFSNKIIAVPIPGGKPLKLQFFFIDRKTLRTFSMLFHDTGQPGKPSQKSNPEKFGSGRKWLRKT